MLGLVGGCIRGIVALVLIAGIAVFAFLNRDRLRGLWQDARGVVVEAPLEPSPELADAAQRKLDAMGDGAGGTTVLSETELRSLLRYRYASLLPAFVDSPDVELDEGRVRITGRVPLDRMPRIDGIGQAASLLPDTTDVTVTGQLLPLESGRIALAVDELTVSRIPLPQRLVNAALERLGRQDEPGLPDDAIALPLPAGARAVYVRGDSLVLIAAGADGET